MLMYQSHTSCTFVNNANDCDEEYLILKGEMGVVGGQAQQQQQRDNRLSRGGQAGKEKGRALVGSPVTPLQFSLLFV